MTNETNTNNSRLHKALAGKNDEFYTRMEDIEHELKHYTQHFKDKTVYCNCDDPRKSNFWKYFKDNFFNFGLSGLVATFYSEVVSPYSLTVENIGGSLVEHYEQLSGDGDFRGDEVLRYLTEADIVVTNPPFSLFRDFIKLMEEHDKKFLVIGNMNAITYKEVFPLIKGNSVWLGVTGFNKGMYFNITEEYSYADTYKFKKEIDGDKVMRVAGVCWLTNLSHYRRNEVITLDKTYEGFGYTKYDNYDAIEVNKVANIPKNYYGVMGVPITFLDKYNPHQFQILGTQRWCKSKDIEDVYIGIKKSVHDDFKTMLNGKETYDRIFIKRKS